jgi:phosphatidate cytidylyltransferase
MSDISPASPKWADLGVRTLTAVVLVPVVLADAWLGGVWFEVLAAFLGVLIAHEWALIAHGRSSSQFALHALAAICAAMLTPVIGIVQTVLIILGIALLSVVIVVLRKQKLTVWVPIGPLYASLPIIALVVLRRDATLGWETILWLFLIVWAADVCAYFAGRTIGGPKLAPKFSPKKTWAGLGGAVLGAAAVSLIFASYIPTKPAAIPLAILAGALAVFEQVGDIFESAFKRHHGVKDSGTLLPGHGGVIDRVDGLVAVAVAAVIIGYLRNPSLPASGLLSW